LEHNIVQFSFENSDPEKKLGVKSFASGNNIVIINNISIDSKTSLPLVVNFVGIILKVTGK
jgi:hypothetical protein